MYKILKAEKLAEKIYLMDVEAPNIVNLASSLLQRLMKQVKEFRLQSVIMTEKRVQLPLYSRLLVHQLRRCQSFRQGMRSVTLRDHLVVLLNL